MVLRIKNKKAIKLLLGLTVLLISGCAFGNKYDYESAKLTIPINTVTNKVIVFYVADLRPYILSGDKQPKFVGLQRNGYGMPFDVTTQSGKPMTKSMTKPICDGLRSAGFKVVLGESDSMQHLVNTAINVKACKIIILKVNDWKSDLCMRITMHVDLILSVYSTQGELIAQNSISFLKPTGSVGLVGSGDLVIAEFTKQIELLFNHDDIKYALRDDMLNLDK